MASIKKGRILVSYCAINNATGKYETNHDLLKQPNSTIPLLAANNAKAIEMSNQYINGKPKFKNYRVNAGKIKYTKINDSNNNYFYDVPLINMNDRNDSKCNLPTPVPEQINPPSAGGRKRRKTMRKKRGSRSRKYKKTQRR